MLSGGGGKLFRIGIKIGGEVAKSLDAAISKTKSKIERLGGSLNTAMGAGKAGFGRVLSAPLWQAAAAGATGIAAGMAQATRTAMGFEKAMAGVTAKLGDKANASEIVKLEELAKRLGRTTQFTASQAAGGMDFLAMAGFSVNDMLQSTEPMLKLAGLGNMELAETADIVSNVLGGMGLKASDSARLVDVMAKAATNGNVDVRMLGETFAYAAPLMSQLGISIEEGATAMALLGDSGIQASKAGTGMRGILNRLVDPPKEAAAALATLGVSAKDANGNFRPFPQLMAEIGKGLENIQGSGNQAALATQLFGVEAGTTGAILARDAASGKFAERLDTITDSAGAADVMYAKMTDNMEGALKRLGSAWEGLQLALAGDNLKGLSGMIDGLAGVLNAVTELSEKNPVLVKTMLGLGIAFIALVALMPFISATLSVVTALGASLGVAAGAGLGASLLAIGAAALPVIAVIAAIVGIGAAVMWAWKNVDWFREGVLKAWNEVQWGAKALWNEVQWVFGAMVSNAQKTWGVLSKIASGVGAVLGVVISHVVGIFSGLFKVVQGAWDLVLGVFTLDGDRIAAGWSSITEGWGQVLGTMRETAAKVWPWITGLFQVAGQRLASMVANLLTAVPSEWTAIFTQARDGVIGVISGLGTTLKGIWDLVIAIFTLNPEGVTKAFETIWSGWGRGLAGMGTLAGAAWKSISESWRATTTWLIQAGSSAVESIGDWFGKLPDRLGKVWDKVKDAAGKAWSWLKTEGVKQLESLVSAWANLPSRMLNVGIAIGKGLLDGVKQGAGRLWNFLTGQGGSTPPANGIQPLPGRQFGGRVRPGQSYVVGERRPEVLTMGDQFGQVVPSIGEWAQQSLPPTLALAADGLPSMAGMAGMAGMPGLPGMAGAAAGMPGLLGMAGAAGEGGMASVEVLSRVEPRIDNIDIRPPAPAALRPLPDFTIQPGAIVVNVSGGADPQDVSAAVRDALAQFQVNLEASYRSLLSD